MTTSVAGSTSVRPAAPDPVPPRPAGLRAAPRRPAPPSRGNRKAKKRSDAPSAQWASSTTSDRGRSEARLAHSQYRPCKTANDGSGADGVPVATPSSRPGRPSSRAATPGGPSNSRLALPRDAPATTGSTSWRTTPNGELPFQLGAARSQHPETLAPGRIAGRRPAARSCRSRPAPPPPAPLRGLGGRARGTARSAPTLDRARAADHGARPGLGSPTHPRSAVDGGTMLVVYSPVCSSTRPASVPTCRGDPSRPTHGLTGRAKIAAGEVRGIHGGVAPVRTPGSAAHPFGSTDERKGKA